MTGSMLSKKLMGDAAPSRHRPPPLEPVSPPAHCCVNRRVGSLGERRGRINRPGTEYLNTGCAPEGGRQSSRTGPRGDRRGPPTAFLTAPAMLTSNNGPFRTKWSERNGLEGLCTGRALTPPLGRVILLDHVQIQPPSRQPFPPRPDVSLVTCGLGSSKIESSQRPRLTPGSLSFWRHTTLGPV